MRAGSKKLLARLMHHQREERETKAALEVFGDIAMTTGFRAHAAKSERRKNTLLRLSKRRTELDQALRKLGLL